MIKIYQQELLTVSVGYAVHLLAFFPLFDTINRYQLVIQFIFFYKDYDAS